MEAILIIVAAIFVLLTLTYTGRKMKKWKLNDLIKERNNSDLTTPEGKNRIKMLNKRIDKMYANLG
jgi:hypothetical protein